MDETLVLMLIAIVFPFRGVSRVTPVGRQMPDTPQDGTLGQLLKMGEEKSLTIFFVSFFETKVSRFETSSQHPGRVHDGLSQGTLHTNTF